MKNVQIDFYEYFKSEPNIQNLKRFEINNFFLKSSFDYTTPKDTLNFEVYIPNDYPQASIIFICKSLRGYEHQGIDGMLCLNVPQCRDAKAKIYFEFEKLHAWIDKFYIKDELDVRYEHPLFADLSPMKDTMIFSENTCSNYAERLKEKVGTFKYCKISSDSETFLIKNIGNYSLPWSSFYKSIPKEYKGLWLMLDDFPIKQRKERITDWTELIEKAPTNFESEFFQLITLSSKSDFYGNHFYIMVGYFIPSADSSLLQWDLILFPNDKTILKEIRRNNFSLKDYKQKIIWGFTFNSSYENLIGRGAFSQKLIDSTILIIGIGALGSNLASSLVRGGVKQLSLMDYDTLEPGNEIRSFYDFKSVNHKKTDILLEKLIAISPYVEITKLDAHFTAIHINKDFEKCKYLLSRYDYIFDCTASMDVTCLLDEMELGFKIINFSITDEAKEFVCLTGINCLAAIKEKVFNELGAVENVGSFYPGAGCWVPTFKANNAEVNMLLNYAIAEIDHKIKEDMPLKTFILKKNLKESSLNIELEYVKV